MRATLVIGLLVSLSHARRVQDTTEQSTSSRENSFASMLLAMRAPYSNSNLASKHARGRSVGMQSKYIPPKSDTDPLPRHLDQKTIDFTITMTEPGEATGPGDLPPVPEYYMLTEQPPEANENRGEEAEIWTRGAPSNPTDPLPRHLDRKSIDFTITMGEPGEATGPGDLPPVAEYYDLDGAD